jgi:creatinine amidohydrolase
MTYPYSRPHAYRNDASSRLARFTRQEALARSGNGAIALLPIGSLEQHGDHLPLGTDTLLVEAVCLAAAAKSSRDVLVAPPLWTGLSAHHIRFGASVTLTQETFTSLVRETAESLRGWLDTVVVVNGHGGNRLALEALARDGGPPAVTYWELQEAAARASDIFPDDAGSIGHAGQAETSMMLALEPSLVGVPAAAFEACTPNDPLYTPHLGESGVIGDAASASSDAGRTFLETAADALAAYLDTFDGGRAPLAGDP